MDVSFDRWFGSVFFFGRRVFCLFVCWFVLSLICSVVLNFLHSFVRSIVRSFSRLFVRLFVYLFARCIAILKGNCTVRIYLVVNQISMGATIEYKMVFMHWVFMSATSDNREMIWSPDSAFLGYLHSGRYA